jgi:hypothetical protein
MWQAGEPARGGDDEVAAALHAQHNLLRRGSEPARRRRGHTGSGCKEPARSGELAALAVMEYDWR